MNLSKSALIGGGSRPRPGEISLAHRGVLFLDELPEFASGTLDALRQPLEDGFVVINRAAGRVVFPSSFMLVAAMNPCRCGYYGDPVKQCSCSAADRQKYAGKVSGPILDRIDIHVRVERVVYEDLEAGTGAAGTTTEMLRTGVESALEMQKERYRGENVRYNSQLSARQIEKYCVPCGSAGKILRKAFEKWNMSARSYHRILRLSRTAADTDCSEEIREEHVLEALQFRFPEDLGK